MLFRKTNTIKSKHSPEVLRKLLIGNHTTIHGLDFIIKDDNDLIRVVSSLDDSEHIYTLPISRVTFNNTTNGTTIKLSSHPRRIDVGGPYLIIIFVIFAIIAGILLLVFGEGNYDNTAKIMISVAAIIYAILYIRLQIGYYDYIRKIKKWIQEAVT
jgi:hypothetical protein